MIDWFVNHERIGRDGPKRFQRRFKRIWAGGFSGRDGA